MNTPRHFIYGSVLAACLANGMEVIVGKLGFLVKEKLNH